MDFNRTIYKKLLTTLQSQGFSFITFADYGADRIRNASVANRIVDQQSAISNQQSEIRNFTLSDDGRAAVVERSRDQPRPAEVPKLILLRHDVEAKYGNALQMAKVQNDLGIKGTYYFRIYSHKGNEGAIREIAALGHEIGYHYDDLSECKGDYEKAIQRFQKNLAYLRQFGPVTSATMEGAPLSKFDNRDLWSKVEDDRKGRVGEGESERRGEGESERRGDGVSERRGDGESERRGEGENVSPIPSLSPSHPRHVFHYTDFGILTEPYFDLDFNEIFYLTDTGRRWDGSRFNVRDKATKENPVTNPEFLKLRFHNTRDIIKSVTEGTFPRKAMLNFHPQRWNDALLPWMKEFVWQNVKNQGKRILLSLRK